MPGDTGMHIFLHFSLFSAKHPVVNFLIKSYNRMLCRKQTKVEEYDYLCHQACHMMIRDIKFSFIKWSKSSLISVAPSLLVELPSHIFCSFIKTMVKTFTYVFISLLKFPGVITFFILSSPIASQKYVTNISSNVNNNNLPL